MTRSLAALAGAVLLASTLAACDTSGTYYPPRRYHCTVYHYRTYYDRYGYLHLRRVCDYGYYSNG